MIEIENDYNKIIMDEYGNIKTSKTDINNHGFGLENVTECIERNHGHIDMKVENSKFRVLLSLKYRKR